MAVVVAGNSSNRSSSHSNNNSNSNSHKPVAQAGRDSRAPSSRGDKVEAANTIRRPSTNTTAA